MECEDSDETKIEELEERAPPSAMRAMGRHSAGTLMGGSEIRSDRAEGPITRTA